MKRSAMGHPRYSSEEIASRGRDLYESQIRPLVEGDHQGDYLVIDIESGEYEVDKNHFTASKRLAERRPDSPRYAMRIGYAAVGRIGSRRGELLA